MKPSNYVLLHYKMIPVDESMNIYIDQVYDLASKLKRSKDLFKTSSSVQNIVCNIKLYAQESREFHVYIESKEKDDINESLTRAIKLFIQTAGVPSFVAIGSNYDAVQEAIKYEGKTLKRKLYDLLDGKHVVDLEDKLNGPEGMLIKV